MIQLDTIEREARFWVFLEYPRETVLARLRDQYPGEDAENAYDTALEQKRESDRQLDEQIARNEKAIEEEHRGGGT